MGPLQLHPILMVVLELRLILMVALELHLTLIGPLQRPIPMALSQVTARLLILMEPLLPPTLFEKTCLMSTRRVL